MNIRHVISLLLVALLSGCISSSRGPYSAVSEDKRDPERARALTVDALKVLETDPEKARVLLGEALNADLYHGPAHNNLGVLYLEAGKLYEAAQEFQWAARLMPGHPDPRMNLAIAFERAGRIDEALTEYHTALEVYPSHLATTQALARCQLRYNRADDTTDVMLSEIAMAGETEEWRAWARLWMVRRGE